MLLAFFVCIGLQMTMAQTVQITGTITGAEDKQPLIGATVLVKGTSIGVTSDTNGKYSINVPFSNTTLLVSYIGTKSQELVIAGRVIINVELISESIGLEEIIVTAMGIKKSEKSLGYSATQVSSADLTATGDRSAVNALQGKVAGINISSAGGAPGASTRVTLRGYSSLGGSNQPLYVIDGIPLDNRLIGSTDINGGLDFGNRANDINPEDIETVTVLKGASGAALYGSRASNGVILITTKKGSAQKSHAKIEVSSSTIFESALKLPEFQNEFGEGWYDGSLSANLEENGSWGAKFDGKSRIWGHIVNNQQQVKPYVALKDNVKDFFEIGKTYNNSVSITNGNENDSYYLSYSNVDADGIMPGDKDSYKRNTFALRGSTKYKEKITFAGSFNYVRKDTKFVPTGQEQSVMDAIWQTPRDISIVDQKNYMNQFNNVDNYYTVFAQNPYYALHEHGNKFVENRIFGNISIEYKIKPWITATYRIGTDVSNSTLKSWRAITLSKRANYNNEKGRVKESSYYNSEINSDFLLNINKKIAEKFEVNVVLGQSFNQRDRRDQSTEVIGLNIPNFYNISNSSSTPDVTATTTQRRLVGAFGTIDLSWNQMIFLNVSGRNDWSSTLPKSNRTFFYPSTSLSFIFSELIHNKNIISYGKIRAGIAKTGNDADPYVINSVYEKPDITDNYRNLNFPLAGSINGFTLGNRIGNEKLKPEITTENEIGTDLRFFNNRIGLDFTYYNRSSTDLIWDATIPSSTGYSRQTMNLGDITNKGIELMVTIVPIKTEDLEWKLSWNFAKNRNKLVRLTEGLEQVSLGGTSSLGFVAKPGYAMGLFEGPVQLLTDDGRPIVNASGLPVQSAEREIYGDAQYKYTMGGTTSITWKGLTLNSTIDIRQGGLMYSRTAEMMYFTGNAKQTTFNDRQPFIIPNSVVQTGTDASGKPVYTDNNVAIDGPSGTFNQYYNQTYSTGQFGKLYLVDKSFVKLRELSISYKLPHKLLEKTVFSGAELSIVGRNLFIWTPKSNNFVDPESTTFGDTNGLQADFGEYGAAPTTRSYGFNIRLTF